MSELKTIYLKKLEKVLSMEDQLIVALPKMADAATNEMLKAGLTDHLAETREHKARIEELFHEHGHTPSGAMDDAFELMLKNAEEELTGIADNSVRDAFIIAAGQSVEHLEIAKYGTLIEWAKQLEDKKGEELLKKTLGEEEAADKKLSSVAEGNLFKEGVNEKAAE